jgi:hypothetical protein
MIEMVVVVVIVNVGGRKTLVGQRVGGMVHKRVYKRRGLNKEE